MAQQFVNNFDSTLLSGLTAGVLSVELQPGDGVLLEAGGTISATDFMDLTIQDGNNIEIIRVTGVATDTLTILRGREGTTDQTWAADVAIQGRITAAYLESALAGGGGGGGSLFSGAVYEHTNSGSDPEVMDGANGQFQYVRLDGTNGTTPTVELTIPTPTAGDAKHYMFVIEVSSGTFTTLDFGLTPGSLWDTEGAVGDDLRQPITFNSPGNPSMYIAEVYALEEALNTSRNIFVREFTTGIP